MNMRHAENHNGSDPAFHHQGPSRNALARTIVALLAVAATTAAMAAPKYDHHVKLTPENSAIGNFPAQKASILTLNPATRCDSTLAAARAGAARKRIPQCG